MEPPVIADCKFEGQPVVLQVILSDINMISVTGKIVQWFVFDLYFFLGEFAAHITGMNQLFLDLCKILLTECDIQSSADVSSVSADNASKVRFCLLYFSK